MLNSKATHILIETIVRQTIKDIKDSPERGIRRLVDMALEFSGGRFQKYFFSIAQMMLEDENSKYYDILRYLMSYADTDRLVKFGMNLGYNGCTEGAGTIRAIESEQGYNIPWTVALDIDPDQYTARQQEYESVIAQGQKLGIFVWQLHVDGCPTPVMPLMEKFPNSAFLLFCHSKELDEESLDSIAELPNLMPVLYFDGIESDIWEKLRSRGIFYSVFVMYGTKSLKTKGVQAECMEGGSRHYIEAAGNMLDGDFFYEAQQVHPVFTAVYATPECPDEIRNNVYAQMREYRESAAFGTFPWEMAYDSCLVDEIISTDAYAVRFDASGGFHISYNEYAQEECNLFEDRLEEIFRRCLPKRESACRGEQ